MKKIIVFVLIANCLPARLLLIVLLAGGLSTAYCQVKITKATHQKTFGGRGGITMGYVISFTNTTKEKIAVDSVKSIADKNKIDFSFYQDEEGVYEISFAQPLKQPEKCRTCIDTSPKPVNLTKGVIIYYKRGEKKSSCKVKKFKELPDVMMP